MAVLIGTYALAQATDTTARKQCQGITQKGLRCKNTAKLNSAYCYLHEANHSNSLEGKTIYTGPKGGKYWIRKNQNGTSTKVYIHQ